MTDIVSPQLKQYRERVAFYIELLGGCCRHCGSSDNLEFDHIVASEKWFNITKAITRSVPEEVILHELEKCQLLCNRCHILKTLVDNGKAQHGTGGMYRHHRCRCDLCRQRNAQYTREYAERKHLLTL